MDIWRLLGAALRRWYVILPVLLLAVLAAVAAGNRVQPEYTAGASVLLVPPVVAAGGNPYADLDTAASSVPIVLLGAPTRAEFLSQGLSADYEVGGVSRTPILRFSVRADDPATAVATAQALIDRANLELEQRQEAAGVDEAFWVRADVLEPASGASETGRGQLQAQVGVFGVGAVLAFLLAVFLDDLVLLWRQRGQRRAASSDRRSERRAFTRRAPSDSEGGEPTVLDSGHEESSSEARRSSTGPAVDMASLPDDDALGARVSVGRRGP